MSYDPNNPMDPTDQTGEDAAENEAKGLRAAAERSKENEARAEKAERELAIVKAGVDTSTPLGQFFAENYSGESDPEKVKAAWEAVAPSTETPDPETPEPAAPVLEPGEAEFPSELSTATSQPAPPSNATPDPNDEARNIYDRILHEENGSEEAAMGGALNFLANAANAGDSRVLLNSTGTGRIGT